jgi:BirA family biotin operon repressor/biotin-[acetyl-CoA-carboxylase] ligase
LPDIILPAILVSGLRCRIMGSEIHSYKTIGSTNEVARRLAEAGAPEGSLVIAEKQSRGRGRLGRSWHSPGGSGLYFSLVLRPQVAFTRLPALSLVAALSICRALETLGDLKAEVKWPNDCLLSGRKVAGILVELSAELDRVSYAILGIGINVNNQRKDLPPSIRSRATSVAMEIGSSVSRVELIRRILNEFERAYCNFQRYGLRFIGPELVSRSAVIGKKIIVTVGRKRFIGQALGFDENGALRIKTRKNVQTVSAGEVSLR